MYVYFLVVCYATQHPALSVRRSHFTFCGFFRSLASLLLAASSSELKYDPCLPKRDWGSRVSCLVEFEPQKFVLLISMNAKILACKYGFTERISLHKR